MSPAADLASCAFCDEWVFSADPGAWPVDGQWAHGACIPWRRMAFPFARTLERGRATLARFEAEGRASGDVGELAELVRGLDDAAHAWPCNASWAVVTSRVGVARCVLRWCEAGPRPPEPAKKTIPPWAMISTG